MSQPIALLSNDSVLQDVLHAGVTHHGYAPALFSLDPHAGWWLAVRAPAAIVLGLHLGQPARAGRSWA